MNESFVVSSVRDVSRACRCLELTLLEDDKHLFELKPYSANRSAAQNKLQHHWYNELNRQSRTIESIKGWDIETIRSECKLRFGVPIMREDGDFAHAWSLVSSHLSYEDKRLVVLYFPVTSLMNVEQKTRFLESVYYHFTPQGAVLTTSADYYYEAMNLRR